MLLFFQKIYSQILYKEILENIFQPEELYSSLISFGSNCRSFLFSCLVKRFFLRCIIIMTNMYRTRKCTTYGGKGSIRVLSTPKVHINTHTFEYSISDGQVQGTATMRSEWSKNTSDKMEALRLYVSRFNNK